MWLLLIYVFYNSFLLFYATVIFFADAGLKQLTTVRNADTGLTFFRHSGIYL